MLDTSALSKRKADMAGVAAWPEDNEGHSEDDFDVDAPSQVSLPAGCSTRCSCSCSDCSPRLLICKCRVLLDHI